MWAVQIKFKLLRHTTPVLLISRFHSDGKTHRLLKLVSFVYKCADTLLTSIIYMYITQPHPPKLARGSMNIINILILLEPLTIIILVNNVPTHL